MSGQRGRRASHAVSGDQEPPRAGDAPMVREVRRRMLDDAEPVTPARLAAAVHSSGRLLGAEGALRAVDRVQAELQGLGPLQELAELPGISDILVNGPDRVWVDSGHGLELTGLRFGSDSEVQSLAARLIAAGGRRLDDSNPCVDVQLRGYRVHAVLRPVSTGYTLLSIRIRRTLTFTLEELQASGAVDPEAAAVLRRIIASRLNFLISGATGTGKTTLLSTLLSLSLPHERLVLVEDAAELDPRHPHVVGLQSRHGNVEGAGSVDQAELVRQALRMRPDRLIVGECRGAEVRELLAAMNTGHDGAGGTIHANSAASVPARLAALGALAGMSSTTVNLQAASALDVVIHLTRGDSGRRIAEIAAVTADAEGRLLAVPALLPLLPPDAPGRHARGWAALQERLGRQGQPAPVSVPPGTPWQTADPAAVLENHAS